MNSGLIGTAIGGFITILSGWVTSVSKRRADKEARHQDHLQRMAQLERERDFRLDDQEREQKNAFEAKKAKEDTYWFDKANAFRVLQAKVFTAIGRDESIRALEKLRDFLEQNPPYLSIGDNLAFFYKFCTSSFIDEHFELGSSHSAMQAYVTELRKLWVPTSEDIRKLRSGMTW